MVDPSTENGFAGKRGLIVTVVPFRLLFPVKPPLVPLGVDPAGSA
jgi:hypothetical protein